MALSFVFVGDTLVGRGISRSLVDAGFPAATDVPEADVIVTFCPTQEALENVYFDADGLLAKAKKGALLIDLSSCSPSLAKEISAMATVSDYSAVDAPLFVSDVQNADAFGCPENLTCLVGADDDAFQAVSPILDAIADVVEHCGLNGAGQTAKAMLTIQAAAQVMGMIEADALGKVIMGPDEAQEYFAIAQRIEAVTPRTAAVHDAVVEERFEGTYTIGIMMSELVAALMAADDSSLIIPQTEACLQLLELVAIIGGVDKTPSILSLVYGDEATCAENGLDWTRAEDTYGNYDHDEDECDCGHEHHHEDDDADGFGGYGYSVN